MTIQFTAGQAVTAAALNALAPLYVLKTVNQTITSSAVQTNDSALFVALPANQTWQVQAVILTGPAATGANGGITTTWSMTSTGALVVRSVVGPSDTVGNVTSPSNYAVQGRGPFTLTTNPAYAFNITAGVTFGYRITEELVVTSGASGSTLQFLWAQTGSSANGTVVLAGSYLIARAIA